jgi:hypothetical protein
MSAGAGVAGIYHTHPGLTVSYPEPEPADGRIAAAALSPKAVKANMPAIASPARTCGNVGKLPVSCQTTDQLRSSCGNQ